MKLKPCPFCGEKKELEGHLTGDDEWTIRCRNCGAIGPPCGTWRDAEISWYERKEGT